MAVSKTDHDTFLYNEQPLVGHKAYQRGSRIAAQGSGKDHIIYATKELAVMHRGHRYVLCQIVPTLQYGGSLPAHVW